MPIIRRRLQPSDVYPDNIRYNAATGNVQSLVNGDWVNNPEIDPRAQTTFPPRLTSDPACDAAQSVVDAIKGQIDATILAIDGASTAFTIAGIILALFTFGVFAIFISIALTIADAMIAAGSGALEAALTGAVYDQLTCILSCHMDSNGRLNAGSLPTVQNEVNGQIGGLGATTINSMLSLAGEGGINNLASLGTSTGDCSECGCIEPCADAADWFAGTINSAVDNGNGTITFNISSVNAGDGTQYAAWGQRTNIAAPCCVYMGTDLAEGFNLGSATRACGSNNEILDQLGAGQCLHYFHLYKNGALTTPWTANIVMGAGC